MTKSAQQVTHWSLSPFVRHRGPADAGGGPSIAPRTHSGFPDNEGLTRRAILETLRADAVEILSTCTHPLNSRGLIGAPSRAWAIAAEAPAQAWPRAEPRCTSQRLSQQPTLTLPRGWIEAFITFRRSLGRTSRQD